MRNIVITAMLLLTCAGCEFSTTTDPGTSGEFTIRFGQSHSVSGTSLRVRFSQLVEESRCPSSAVCVWMGNARIRLDVTSGSRTETILLNTAGDSQFPREAAALGHTFRLESLLPYPQTSGPADPNQYVAEISIRS